MEQLPGNVNLVELLTTAAKLGVRRLEFGPLKIEFGVPVPVVPKDAVFGPRPAQPEPTELPKELTAEQEKALEDLREELELEQIKLMDPLRYEELLAEGEIEDVQDEQNDRGA